MQIKIKLFATLRQQAGWSEKEVALPVGAAVGQLLEAVSTMPGELDLNDRPVYVAVNQEYANKETILRAGDEVALFPPVSGGAG
jgi:molybdopterin synthase catalytic subunit